jgi:hypothetical protein
MPPLLACTYLLAWHGERSLEVEVEFDTVTPVTKSTLAK